jgi:hypothetical protein
MGLASMRPIRLVSWIRSTRTLGAPSIAAAGCALLLTGSGFAQEPGPARGPCTDQFRMSDPDLRHAGDVSMILRRRDPRSAP